MPDIVSKERNDGDKVFSHIQFMVVELVKK